MSTGQRLTAIVAALALVIAAGAVVFALSGDDGNGPGRSAQAQTPEENRGISVDGQGQVSVEPDTARVTLGIEVEGTDIGALREDSNTRMDEVIDALEAEGIAEEDIRTVAYDVFVVDDHQQPPPPPPVPEESQQDDEQAEAQEPATDVATPESAEGENGEGETGDADADSDGVTTYRLVQLLQATVRDIDMTGDIIDVALDQGANRVSGIHFDVEDRAEAVNQAREQAVEDARQKAEHLAELTGVNLGSPLAVQDRSPVTPYYGTGMAAQERAMADGDTAAQIQPGESVITVDVHIVYAIE